MTRRMLRILCIFLCAWLTARETLCVLFDFRTPLLPVLLLPATVLLAFLLSSKRRRRICALAAAGVIGLLLLYALIARTGLSSLWPVRVIRDFIGWIAAAPNSPSLPLEPFFGSMLWLLIGFACVLVCVLTFDTLRFPSLGCLVLALWFSVLDLLPYVQDPDPKRLMVTLLGVLFCCFLLIVDGRRDLFVRPSAPVFLLIAPVLVPVCLCCLYAIIGGGLQWRSARIASLLERSVLSEPDALPHLPIERLDVAELEGEPHPTDDFCFSFRLASNCADGSSLYLRTAVFDLYDGRQWQRSPALSEDVAAYSGGSYDFSLALQGVYPAEQRAASSSASYSLADAAYASYRWPTPLGVSMMAAVPKADFTAALTSPDVSGDAVLSLHSGVPTLFWDISGDGWTSQALPTVELHADRAGEVTSVEPIHRQIAVGALRDFPVTSFSDGLPHTWPFVLDRAISEAEWIGDPDAALAAALTLSETLPEEVYALAERLRCDSPYQTALALRAYLRESYPYALTSVPAGSDFVSSFLFDAQQGYCTAFASAMTVLARCTGIPARYVQGYLVPHKPNETVAVLDRDRHAWCELWFDGVGWVTFDATGSPGAPTGHPLTRAELLGLPEEPDELPEPPEPPETPPPAPAEETPPEQSDAPAPTEDEPEVPETPARRIGAVLLIVVFALCAAAVPLTLFWYTPRALRRTLEQLPQQPDRTLAVYHALTALCAQLGAAAPANATVGETFDALASLPFADEARRIRAAEAVNVVAYAERLPAGDDYAALCALLNDCCTLLLEEYGSAGLLLRLRRLLR